MPGASTRLSRLRSVPAALLRALPLTRKNGPPGASRGPSWLASVTGTYEFGVTLSLALLIVAVSVWAPRFLSTTNLMNVARNFAFNTAAAAGEAL